MPESRYTGLAQALANRGEGRGFWRTVGDVFSATPIGRLAHGDFRGAWNATPAGMAVNGIRGLFGPRSPSATPMGSVGPTIGGYGGAPSPFAPSPVEFGGTNWGEQINPGNPAAAGPWQGAPALLPGQSPAASYSGAASSAGAWNGAAGGLGRLMMSTNPWRQSGENFFGARQGEN